MEAEAENWSLLWQAGGGEMTQRESGTNYKLAAGRNMYWPAGLLRLAHKACLPHFTAPHWHS